MAILTGDQGDNLLVGTSITDTIDAGAGNDILNGKSGDDLLYGRLGDDTIYAEAGLDRVSGGLGNDLISGGVGRDRLWGDEGNDRLYGDDQDDQLYGGFGLDRLDGGNGDDVLYGQADNDQLYGRSGNDRLYGGEGDDIMFGGVGNDMLSSGGGADVMTGNAGADVFRFDFQQAGGEVSDAFVTIDHADAAITDFQVGTDRLALTWKLFGDGPGGATTTDVPLGFDVLDTDGSGQIDGLDDYTSIASGNLVLHLNPLFAVNDGIAMDGAIELQDVTSLHRADIVG